MELKGFLPPELSEKELKDLSNKAHLARGDILKMTTLAKSGHPGGSMSSIDIYTVLYHGARISPEKPHDPDRDRIVISHGHTSPGVYAALARRGFFPIDAAIAGFRLPGSPFEGHVEKKVPGVEWNTGNLGQGLSAGCGFALSAKLLKKDFKVYVVMGCGEQQKGQISEARRFAKKYDLDIIAIIDYNNRQISGITWEIMPQMIRENYESDRWKVIEVNGHDLQEIYQAIRRATHEIEGPTAIIAHTVMGKGVSFMEGKEEFHGKALNEEQYIKAMEELGLDADLTKYKKMRKTKDFPAITVHYPRPKLKILTGEPREYSPEDKTDNRSAYGKALEDLGRLNCVEKKGSPIAVFDCDLASSVKSGDFAKICPANFFQAGIQEHNTATMAGALSTCDVLVFFSDFGVFGVDETYNQQRLNDINETNLKLVCTHNGLDVGEDGKTHQCIDYLGVLSNIFGFKIIIPADPNQTDKAVRYAATHDGNFFIGVGRSKVPVITKEDGSVMFGKDYLFEYGKIDLVRDGDNAAIFTMGHMLFRAIKAWEILKEEGIKVKIFNVSSPRQIDGEMIKQGAETGLVITYEDHNIETGLGSRIALELARRKLSPRFMTLGVTRYGDSAPSDELFKSVGLSPQDLANIVSDILKQ